MTAQSLAANSSGNTYTDNTHTAVNDGCNVAMLIFKLPVNDHCCIQLSCLSIWSFNAVVRPFDQKTIRNSAHANTHALSLVRSLADQQLPSGYPMVPSIYSSLLLDGSQVMLFRTHAPSGYKITKRFAPTNKQQKLVPEIIISYINRKSLNCLTSSVLVALRLFTSVTTQLSKGMRGIYS